MKLGKKIQRPKLPGAQAPGGSPQGSSIASFFTATFYVLMFVLLLSGLSLYWLQSARNEQQGVAQIRVGAEALSGRLQVIINLYADLLSRLAKNQSIASALIEEDKISLRRQEQRLKTLIPGAVRVRLLPFGYQDTDTSTKPPFSFDSLELLRTAEKTKGVTRFELHQFGSDQQHIAVATKIVNQGQLEPAGVMHVVFPTSLLKKGLTDISNYGGRVEVQQLDEGEKPVTLIGNSSPPGISGSPDGVLPVLGSIWQVAYWAIPGESKGWSEYLTFFGVLLAALVVMGIVLFFQTRRLQEALRADLASIVSLVDGMTKGKPARNLPAKLKEVWGSLALIAKMARESQNGSRRKASAKPISEAEMVFDEPDLDAASEAAAAGVSLGSLLPSSISVSVEPAEPVAMPRDIFRAYDIRGVVGESLTEDVVYDIGRAIGSEAYDQGQQTVIIGRDGRDSSPQLCDALSRGLQDSGRDVIDLGMVPTPVVYFATHYLGSNSGVMMTGSHNPPQYNGLKVVLGGDAIAEEAIQALRERVERGNLLQGDGGRQEQDLVPDYLGRILDDVRLAKRMKVVLDCGNGVAGIVAPDLYRALGCEVIELFCEVDGSFPAHHPDPSAPENLQALVLEVQAQDADIGLAFDGDGDRLGVVDGDGNIIWPDRLLMLLATDVLSRQPGADIIYDVKCTKHLASEILSHGGCPVMWKSGHSIMKAKLKETGALLGGELSGHIIFKERWFGFDDALYAAARLLEVLSVDSRTPAEVFADQPRGISTPELKVDMQEGQPAMIINRLLAEAQFPGAEVTTMDGLRAEFEIGWGLIRASNTTPSLVFRFEAENEPGLVEIQKIFRRVVSDLAPEVKLPF